MRYRATPEPPSMQLLRTLCHRCRSNGYKHMIECDDELLSWLQENDRERVTWLEAFRRRMKWDKEDRAFWRKIDKEADALRGKK